MLRALSILGAVYLGHGRVQGEAPGADGCEDEEVWTQKWTPKAFRMDGGVGTENPGVTPDFLLSAVGLADSVEMSLESLSLFPDPSALSLNLCLSRLSLCCDPSLLPLVGSLYPDVQPLSHLSLSSHPPNGLRPPLSKRPPPCTCLLVSLSPTPALLCKSGDLIYTT